MSINYVYIVFYDIEMDTPEKIREYRIFKKNLSSKGFLMLQESVYIKQILEKSQAKRLANEIILIAPKNSNIRGLLVTQRNFQNMKILSGELEFSEKIVKKENAIIEIWI